MTASEKRIRKTLNDFALKPVIKAAQDRNLCCFCASNIKRFDEYRKYGKTEAHENCIIAVRRDFK